MAFYNLKGKTEGVFKIKTTQGKESYSVWDNTNRRFMRDGNMTDNEGTEHPVQDTKYIKADDFTRMFPSMNKNNKVRWEVIVDNEELTWEAPRSVDQALNGCIANVTAMGQSPMMVEYKWSKTGEGLSTRYTVVIHNQTAETPSTTPSSAIELNISTPSVPVEKVELTEIETSVVGAIKGQGNNFTFDQLKDTFLKYNITEERAKTIYEQELK
jgi:hypothetical protein